MPEHDAFETRFRRAYRRYVDEAPTDVDAAAVARAAATQRRFEGFRWPTIGAPARVLMWVGLLALLLAALAAGSLLTGSEGPANVATDVSGTSACATTDGRSVERADDPRGTGHAPVEHGHGAAPPRCPTHASPATP